MLYFAYGSNMCTGRLRNRVPSAAFTCIAKLVGYSFRCHKKSSDGSAKGDALETGNQSDVVWGVVFNVEDREKPALDTAESGYREKMATVLDERGQEHRVLLYIAAANNIDATLRPYSWYKRFIVEGARQHALPGEYIERIAAMPDTEDSDRERDARKRSIGC